MTIGFTVIFCVLGVLTIMIAAMVGKEFLRQTMTGDRKDDGSGDRPKTDG